jgi:hypothetical protein
MDNFIQPLKQNQLILFQSKLETVIDCLDPIINFSEYFYSLLSTCEQDSIGQVFLAIVPFIKLYITYCENYRNAVTQINNEKENNTQFCEWLIQKETKAMEQGRLDILSYILLPTRRIVHYVQILKVY